MAADLNLLTTTPSELTQLLHHCIDVQRPAMIWGSPGIGKSDLVEQLGKATGRPVIDIRLILMEPTDIKGIPYFCRDTKKMKWSVSEELPIEGEGLDNAILFLDEINSAPQSVQGAAYQLILNRRIGTHYQLPKETVIIAAGNHMTDRGVTYQMPSPLANRFIHFNLVHNFDDWIKWAVNNNISPNIISFLSANKRYLFEFKPGGVEQAFATPRTWTFASQLIKPNLDQNTATLLLAGLVGQAKALEYIAYQKLCNDLPDAEQILSGKIKTLKKEGIDLSVHYSLVTNLCFILKETWNKNPDKFETMIVHYLEFSMENFEVEMVVFSLKVLFQDFGITWSPSQVESKTFKKFITKYGKYLPHAK